MNEINFEIQDIEKIDLSMDVGIKEIYPPIENLEVTPTKEQQVFNHDNSYGYDEVKVNPIPDEYIIPDGTLPITENATYDVTNYARVSASVYPEPNLQDKSITITENGTQNITYDSGYDGLNSVEVTTNIEGSSTKGQVYMVDKYSQYSVTTGTSLTRYLDFGKYEDVNLVVVFGFVRSDYTISDNFNLLVEKECPVVDEFYQKLIVGYVIPKDYGEQVILTQTGSGRLGLFYIPLCNADIPQVIDDVEGGTREGLINITADNDFNLYVMSQVYGASLTGSNFVQYSESIDRLAYYLSTYAGEKQITWSNGSYSAFVHLKIPPLN